VVGSFGAYLMMAAGQGAQVTADHRTNTQKNSSHCCANTG
jgi:hypothetical protein